jgi:4-amino-4-deoxy-L-arabinose transferase-like glycosyltransferase
LKQPFLPTATYIFFFSLLSIVYIFGLFVPLMDNDAAHHATIALHMYLSRDYVNLIDAGKDYLDKPHLHFWLCAFSYKIFGVTTFAYKLPSFLFTILGTYSSYRLGKSLYNKEVGKLAALIIASAFAYMLANTDVRMDAILTACIAFATWQGVEFIQQKKILPAFGLGLGLALGFSTKGHIAVFTPAIGILFYILYLKEWKTFLNWKWLLVLLSFAAFIFPTVYCYYLQFNLHPEKIVRGKDHINGVKFILLGQSVERFSGEGFGGNAKNDYLFFFHSFLWAFAPWSILAFIAAFSRIKNYLERKDEWLTISTIIIIALLLTFSSFKLPHYLNITFPAAAVLVASWVLNTSTNPKIIYGIQAGISALVILLVATLNVLAFPVNKPFILIGMIFFLSVFFYFLINYQLDWLQKAVAFSVAMMVFSFFLLNTNFYPQLLNYQGGNELAKKIKGNVDPANVFFWGENYSSSFNFYTASERKQFTDSLYSKSGKPVWLLFDKRNLEDIKKAGYRIGSSYSAVDYEVSKLDLKFVDPSTRDKNLTELFVGEITVKQ